MFSDIRSAIMLIIIYWDIPNSFMVPLNSLRDPLNFVRGPVKAHNFQITLWQQNKYLFRNLKVFGVQWLTQEYSLNPQLLHGPLSSLRGPLKAPEVGHKTKYCLEASRYFEYNGSHKNSFGLDQRKGKKQKTTFLSTFCG